MQGMMNTMAQGYMQAMNKPSFPQFVAGAEGMLHVLGMVQKNELRQKMASLMAQPNLTSEQLLNQALPSIARVDPSGALNLKLTQAANKQKAVEGQQTQQLESYKFAMTQWEKILKTLITASGKPGGLTGESMKNILNKYSTNMNETLGLGSPIIKNIELEEPEIDYGSFYKSGTVEDPKTGKQVNAELITEEGRRARQKGILGADGKPLPDVRYGPAKGASSQNVHQLKTKDDLMGEGYIPASEEQKKKFSKYIRKSSDGVNMIKLRKVSDNDIVSLSEKTNAIDEMKNLIAKVKQMGFEPDPISGAFPITRKFLKSPEWQAIAAEFDRLFQQFFRKPITGAQASDKEIAKLKPLSPQADDLNTAVLLLKADNFIKQFERSRQSIIKGFEDAMFDTTGLPLESASTSYPPSTKNLTPQDVRKILGGD